MNIEMNENQTASLKLGLSYTAMLKKLIHSANAIKDKEHEFISPFNNKGQTGYFLYLTNRTFERYSYLYTILDSKETYDNCTLPMGYTNLWLCKSIEYIDSGDLIVLDQIPVLEDCESYEFVVFKDPTKTNYKIDDVLGGFLTFDEAKEYSKQLKQNYKLSTLIAKKEDNITWH